MITAGTAMKLASGDLLTVGLRFATGGQADLFHCTSRRHGKCVLKVFHDATPATQERCRVLVRSGLADWCPVLNAPLDIVEAPGLVAHISRWVEGSSIGERMDARALWSFTDALVMAAALSHALAALAAHGWFHGDLARSNLFCGGGRFVPNEMWLIDLDNFGAPGLPPPMLGQLDYLAPELRVALAKGNEAVPNAATERFGLAVLMHELLLLKSPWTGLDATAESYYEAATRGWGQDPVSGHEPGLAAGGYPVAVLGPRLHALFRSALGVDPDARPSPAAWHGAFVESLRTRQLAACPHCGGHFLAGPNSTICPYPACRRPFAVLALQVDGGPRVVVDSAAVPVGRAHCNGNPVVSERHAILRRHGPDILIEPLGRNGTEILQATSGNWKPLDPAQAAVISIGARLRLAGAATASVVAA